MIRVRCPKCEKSLAVDDSRAGSVGTCPACGQKLRVPGKKTQPAQAEKAALKAPPRTSKTAESKTAKPTSRAGENSEGDDSLPYTVEKAGEAEVPKELRQSMHSAEDVDEDTGYENVGLDREYVAQRKARRLKEREGQLLSSYFMAIRLFLGLVWAGVLALAFFQPPLVWVGFAVAAAVVLAGMIWFVIVALQDGGVHWNRAKQPFYTALIGCFILASILAVKIYHDEQQRRASTSSLPQNTCRIAA